MIMLVMDLTSLPRMMMIIIILKKNTKLSLMFYHNTLIFYISLLFNILITVNIFLTIGVQVPPYLIKCTTSITLLPAALHTYTTPYAYSDDSLFTVCHITKTKNKNKNKKKHTHYFYLIYVFYDYPIEHDF